MLVVSVTVNAWYTAPTWFAHAPWLGVHSVDLVFPTFVTLSGAGLGILYARGVRPLREARRVVVLLAAGLAYSAMTQYLVSGAVDVATLRVTGVLQLYAVVVSVVALVSTVATSWWRWLVAAGLLAGTQLWILLGSAASCPGGLTPECNPSRDLDLAWLGVHAYAGGRLGHDPEGLVAILGALVSAMVGAAAGRLLRDRRDTAHLLRGGTILLAACLVMTAVTSAVVPAFKRLWTAPFALGVAAAVVLILLALYLLLDTREVGRVESAGRFPLIALGRNSLLVYFGSHVVMEALVLRGPHGSARGDAPSWADLGAAALADAVGMPGSPWPFCVAAVLAWTVIAGLLHRFGVYIKA